MMMNRDHSNRSVSIPKLVDSECDTSVTDWSNSDSFSWQIHIDTTMLHSSHRWLVDAGSGRSSRMSGWAGSRTCGRTCGRT